MSRYDADDVYCYPGTDVLRNKFDIRDAEFLDQIEADLTTARLIQITEDPIEGSFDLLHLMKIHFWLFQDLYDWAGEIRTVDISRDGSRFANVSHIQSYAESLFSELANENWLKDLHVDQVAIRLAHYLSEINALHPFREGNGRVQRTFIAALANEAGYLLDYSDLSQEEIYPVIRAAFNGDETSLTQIIRGRLQAI